MVNLFMKRKICDVCNQHFHPDENRSGIVVNEDHFICEPCTKKLESDEMQIPSSIMADETKAMPIALWLIKEENKDKPFMSVKKR